MKQRLGKVVHARGYALHALILALLLLFPTGLCASVSSTGLHADVAELLKQQGLTGAVWATADLENGITVGAAGIKDARSGQLLRPDDRVHVGSVAKTLIATGVLRLVTDGKLSLDTPVALLLPDVELHNPWEASHPLLLRHLLDHTSGLDDARLWQVFSLKARPDSPLRASLGRDPSLMRVRSRPGTRLSYSNMGYTLVGMVIEGVVDDRYETYLDAHLLRPLGMHSSSFHFISQIGPNADAQLAMGHFENKAAHPAVASYLRPAGQFTTTAADMARFARFLMSNGEINGVPFVDQELLRAMGRPSTTEAVAAGLDAGYGLGLSRRDRHGVIGRCHVGTAIGYRANLCIFPEEQKAFFISMNADVETADYERFNALLIHALRFKPTVRATQTNPPAEIADWEGIYALSPSRTESFAYLDIALNFAVLSWDGARLQLKPFQAAAKVLTPVGGMRFQSDDKITASHVLLTSSNGRRVISDGLRTFEQISRWRIAPLWASLAAGLSGLVYLVLVGLVRMVRRRFRPADPLFVPFLAVVALVLPVPFFLGQSFVQLGDLTPASALLAVVTAALPLAMLVGLGLSFRRRPVRVVAVLDGLAMLAVLQWTLVLAAWGLVPLQLWT